MLSRWSVSPETTRRAALLAIAANVLIVITGGAVRLTGSGLGCPTFPRCTEDSLVNTPELGIHGYIEFGNRLITFVVGAATLAALITAVLRRPRRRSLIWWALGALLVIPGQALVGGITVLTELNPWVVACHFLVSVGAIAACWTLWVRAGEPDGPVRLLVPTPLRQLAWVTTAVSFAVIVVGTVVTGSGPHAGDENAPRTGLDPESISQLHADLVFLLLGLSVALWLALRAVQAPQRTVRAAVILIIVELAQGLVGFVQYFTQLPVLLVGMHMAGACAVWLATLHVLFSTRTRDPGTAEPLVLVLDGSDTEEDEVDEDEVDEDDDAEDSDTAERAVESHHPVQGGVIQDDAAQDRQERDDTIAVAAPGAVQGRS